MFFISWLWAVGDSAIDVEKVKANGSALNRGKKRQLKSNAGTAWGKLLSQYPPQVSFTKFFL